MFQNTVARLTFWYVLIVMGLSLAFSISLYRVSTTELNADQHRLENLLQQRFLIQIQPGFVEFNKIRLEQIEAAKHHIELNLIYFNVIILAAAGGASYLLARRTLKPIEDAMEAQARFTADASHELRTPLTAMKSEIEVALRDKNLTLNESKELHKSTLEEVARLESLSNGLLRLAKQEKPALYLCQLKDIIETAVSRAQTTATKRSIHLRTDITDGQLLADRWALEELVSVLLDNAIKYSPEGSTVLITSSLTQHRHMAHISIKDQGPGIKSVDLPHIFDRFYRADSSRTSTTIPGYGLGLSIAKKIVELHGGSIDVQTTLGAGSTFTVHLPLKAVAEVAS
jgi:two-component system sensor histidine kinase CiaH